MTGRPGTVRAPFLRAAQPLLERVNPAAEFGGQIDAAQVRQHRGQGGR